MVYGKGHIDAGSIVLEIVSESVAESALETGTKNCNQLETYSQSAIPLDTLLPTLNPAFEVIPSRKILGVPDPDPSKGLM